MNPDLNPIVQSLNRLIATQQKGPWDYASTVAVVLTLLVLIWYTIETYKLRREAQRQNEHSMMPIVVLQSGYFPPHTLGSSLAIRNLGAGPALNIQIDSIQISGHSAVFEHPIVLAPGQDAFVALSGLREPKMGPSGAYDDGKIHGTIELLRLLKSTPDNLDTNCVITYMSASGKKYRTKSTLDCKSDGAESFAVFVEMQAL